MYHGVLCFALVCVVVTLTAVCGQSIEDEFNNPCTGAKSCGECIRTSPTCAWCGMENFTRSEARCDIMFNLRKKCDMSAISNPQLVSNDTVNKPWTSGQGNQPPVQVKPQQMEFKLRPNEPVSFKLKFRQQENYPVDLYFLLDISYGMQRQTEAKDRLITLGNDISKKMLTITNNFHLGFGTFVDKLLMPYSPWTDQLFKDRCQTGSCRRPHDFRNEVNLGTTPAVFSSKMTEALEDISLSFDDAEGGLDGLIQALDCREIGWRSVSRRIIVYSSNSRFHTAGAGKLGGATKQSKLECALSKEGFYKEDTIYDYPSVSQIAAKMQEKKANVIFAVMKNVSEHYHQLAHFLDGAVVGELQENSKNIVELISNKYFELRSKIQFQPRNADHVNIQLKSKCRGDIMKETNKCENLEIMDSVEFDVTMSVHKDICEGQSGIVYKEVSLDAVGLNEAVIVKLNVTCDCQCEMPGQEKPDSLKCHGGNGTFECGICSCNEGRYGRLCECDQTQISSEESFNLCRRNKNESLLCEGKGECVCGQCECYNINDTPFPYRGEFCECNDYNCPTGEHGLCGGSQRGVCNCGKCACLEHWSGPNCECSTKQDKCMASNGLLCNNNGSCVCGRCECNKGSKWFGPTCEECPNCPTQCSEHFACAQCTIHAPGTLTVTECERECPNVVDVSELKESDGVRKCEGTSNTDGCTIYFTYEYIDNGEVLIKVQKTKRCPQEAPVAAIAGGTAAAVVLIGLLLILLLVCIRNRRDAKEYAEFMDEKNKARWDSGANPIYKDPKSTFKNPTYKGHT